MAKDDDRIKRHALNSHTRRGNYRDAMNNHDTYSAANRRQQYESASSEGREWDDHQYIDKVKTKSGRIRYIYEDTASTGGNHAKRAKPITKNDLRYAKSEFNKGKEAISNAASQARDAVMETGHKIDKALNDAASTISRGTTPSVNPTASGSNYVSKQMSKSANIPVKDLFK